MAEGGVGDIKSQEVGSGARYNVGKPPLDYIPYRVQAAWFRANSLFEDPETKQWIACLDQLGRFQEGGDLLDLHRLLNMLGPPEEVQDETAFVFEYGAKKYASWNWAKGMAWSIPMECAARHLRRMIHGEAIDLVERQGSGLPHRGHVGCNVVMLIHYASMAVLGHPVFKAQDNRPPRAFFNVES